MSTYYYFDTCPLLRWAETLAGEVDNRCVIISEEIQTIINTHGNINAISEITLA